MNNHQPQLIWRGQSVGLFDNPVPDMWYMEGYWLSNQTEAADTFETLAKHLNLQEVYRDWDKGIEIIIQHAGEQTRAVVFGLSSERLLLVRRIYS